MYKHECHHPAISFMVIVVLLGLVTYYDPVSDGQVHHVRRDVQGLMHWLKPVNNEFRDYFSNLGFAEAGSYLR